MAKDQHSHDPIPANKRDKMSPVWDMSQERAFIENLLGHRFNYFLIFFSVVVAGFVNSKNPLYGQFILTLGAVITTLLASVLRRSQQKLDLILADLFMDSTHPAKIIDDRAGGPSGSRRKLIGRTIPSICSWTLIVGAVVHLAYLICLYWNQLICCRWIIGS